jgi:hypothetical protein
MYRAGLPLAPPSSSLFRSATPLPCRRLLLLRAVILLPAAAARHNRHSCSFIHRLTTCFRISEKTAQLRCCCQQAARLRRHVQRWCRLFGLKGCDFMVVLVVVVVVVVKVLLSGAGLTSSQVTKRRPSYRCDMHASPPPLPPTAYSLTAAAEGKEFWPAQVEAVAGRHIA